MNKEIQRIKDIVEETLSEDERTRNSDHWLILQVLKKMGFKIYIDYKELNEMPSFETITRARRFIQNNNGDYTPTREIDEIRNKRREENHLIWKNGYLS